MSASLRNWGITIVVSLLIMMGLKYYWAADAKLSLYLSVTAFIILVWAFELLPAVLAAILLPLVYLLLELAPPNVIFMPWSTFLPWVCVAGLVFGDILGRTGIAKRIALMCVKAMGGSFTAIVTGLMIAGIILAILVPAIMARVVIFYAITCGFAEAFELKHSSRMSSALLMAGFFAATSPSILCLTGSDANLLGINVINAKESVITWGSYFIHNLPVSLLYCASSVVLLHLIKGKETLPARDVVAGVVKTRLDEMGAVSFAEIKTLLLLLAGIALFVLLGPKVGPWVFLGMACLAFFPGISLINEKQMRCLNFSFIFFVSGCMTIGFVAGHLGIPAKIGAFMVPVLEGESGLASILLSYGAGVGLNFLLTPLAATSSMSAPLVEVAAQLNMHPAPFIYSFLYGLEQYIFPYEYALFLFFFMDNRLTLGHAVPALAIRMVTTLVLLAGVAYPYWKMLGIA